MKADGAADCTVIAAASILTAAPGMVVLFCGQSYLQAGLRDTGINAACMVPVYGGLLLQQSIYNLLKPSITHRWLAASGCGDEVADDDVQSSSAVLQPPRLR